MYARTSAWCHHLRMRFSRQCCPHAYNVASSSKQSASRCCCAAHVHVDMAPRLAGAVPKRNSILIAKALGPHCGNQRHGAIAKYMCSSASCCHSQVRFATQRPPPETFASEQNQPAPGYRSDAHTYFDMVQPLAGAVPNAVPFTSLKVLRHTKHHHQDDAATCTYI